MEHRTISNIDASIALRPYVTLDSSNPLPNVAAEPHRSAALRDGCFTIVAFKPGDQLCCSPVDRVDLIRGQ